MDNTDRLKIKQLLERYGYNSMKAEMALNESFTNNILRTLFMVNKNEHIGLDGKKVGPLSPIGASFALAFPILWDKIPEKNISVLLDNRFKENIPNMDSQRLDDNTYDTGNNYSSTSPLYNQWRRYKPSSYVANGREQEELTVEFNRNANQLEHLGKKFLSAIQRIEGAVDFVPQGVDKSKAIAERDRLKEVHKIIVNAAKMLRDAVNRRDNAIDDSYFVTVADMERAGELIGRPLPSSVIGAVRKAEEMFKENTVEAEGKDKNGNPITVTRRYGTEEKIRTQPDFMDDYELVDDMKYVLTSAVVDAMVERNMFPTEDSVKDIVSYYSSRYIKNRDDIKRFLGAFDHAFFAKEKRSVDYYNMTKEEKNSFAKEVEEKLEPIHREIKDIYKEKRETLKKSGSSEAATLLKELYMKGSAFSGHGVGELRHTIADKIREYNVEGGKRGYSFLDSTKDDFKLTLLTDSQFRILYVVSIIRFKNKYGFEYEPYGLYGWEEGITPVVLGRSIRNGESVFKRKIETEEGTKEKEYRRSDGSLPNRAVDFGFSRLDPDMIYNDDRIRAAIVINGNCTKTSSIDDDDLFNKELLERFKEESLANTNAEGNIESKNIDGVITLLKKYHIPYKMNIDGTITIEYEVFDDDDYDVFGSKIVNQLGLLGFDEKKFNELMDDLKTATEDVDMFNPDFTKQSAFDAYYLKKTKGKRYKGSDGKKITNSYKDYLVENELKDSYDNRVEFDRQRENIYDDTATKSNEIENEVNDYLISRDSIIRLYAENMSSNSEMGTLGDSVRTRQSLATARGNRYLTPSEEREAKEKGTLGYTEKDAADAAAKARNMKITMDDIDGLKNVVATTSVDVNGWTELYKRIKTDYSLEFATFDKLKQTILDALTTAKLSVKKNPDNCDAIYDVCRELVSSYVNMISSIEGVGGADTEKIGEIIIDFTKEFEDFAYNKFYDVGVKIEY